ncbi:uncharacterized protein LOC142639990 [Castanea sativa]|uniref:uncharacterized protein LOC142639990 n=1 Tax=Castanea sativa TaxID=21020 RepID=UPI003F64B80E
MYNSRTDPVEHVSHFNQRIVVHLRNEALMCKVFPSNLGPVAIRWFDGLEEGLINSFQELIRAFGARFVTCSRVPRSLDSLLSMTMREGETLKTYSDRPCEMLNGIDGNFEDVAIRTFKRSQVGSAHQRDASSRPPLGTICVLLATPGRTGSYPSRVLSIARPRAEDLIPDSKRGRMEVRPALSFSDGDKVGTFQPHDDALVVTLRIGGYNVTRVLVDQGIKAEIMNPDLYKRLTLKLEDLVSYNSPLVGFDGKTVIPRGQIRLLVQAGSEIVEVDFIVVDAYSPCTVIMARPWLHAMGAVSLTLYLKVKYPSGDQVEELIGSQDMARQYLVVAIRHQSKGKFLGYMVTHRGIEVNPDHIKAINDLQPPWNPKEVQKLTGMTVTLNKFISQSADRCWSFFQLLHKWKGFEWNKEYALAFQQLKDYLSQPPIMSRPKEEEVLFAYVAVASHAVSLVLVRVENGV